MTVYGRHGPIVIVRPTGVCNQFEHLISLWRSHAAMVTDLAIQDAYENRWRRDADDGWVKVDE